MCRVSVLMPVKNGQNYIELSIQSVLDQTYTDFELIIIDDGSTDDTHLLLKKYSSVDNRVKVIFNNGLNGIANALNVGINYCSGEFVARIDHDDLALPDRLKTQVEFMDLHPDISIVGSWIEMIDAAGKSIKIHREPVCSTAVWFQSYFGTPFAHPSVVIRKASLGHLTDLYREMPAQDYELWVRMINAGLRGANIPRVLTRYRVFNSSDSNVRASEHSRVANEISRQQTFSVLGDSLQLDVLQDSRCKQIAYALICGVSFDFIAGDEKYGDSILEFLRSISDEKLSSVSERKQLDIQLSDYWYAARAALSIQTQLSRKNELNRGLRRVSRYLNALLYKIFPVVSKSNFQNIPIIINARDRVTELMQLTSWLERAGHKRIIIIDNFSTYKPLCDFLDSFNGEVIRLKHNLGHTALWQIDELSNIIENEWFVYTDPDVIPVLECPLNAIAYFYKLLIRFPKYEKAGFGLKVDDLPDCFKLKKEVINWESKQYGKELMPNVYEADIDTTFALYRPGTKYCYGPAIRTRGEYQARHMPWYIDSEKLTDEEIYYRNHALKNVTTWSNDVSTQAFLEKNNV